MFFPINGGRMVSQSYRWRFEHEAISRRRLLAIAGSGAAGLALASACRGLTDGNGSKPTPSATRSDLYLLSLEDAAKLVAAKQVSPVELTEAALARIEQLQPKLNAFITITGEQARAQARAAESEIVAGNYRGKLHGIPIAHKDVFDTAGVLTTAGSKVYADRVPDKDATVVARLGSAGVVGIGKLNLLEFASGLAGVNPHYGATRNPWNLDMFSGGSSSGSGAATSAGLVYAATGTDSGGSVRLPASFCGIVGLLPTYGRVSLRGVFVGTPTFDHAGPLARTVRDAGVMLQAMAGSDPLDPTTADMPVPDYLDGIERGPKGLRIGVPREYFWQDLDPEIKSAVQSAIDAMERAGAEVRDVSFPKVDQYLAASGVVGIIETMKAHAATFPSRKADYGTDVAALLDLYRATPESALEKSRQGGLKVVATARAGEADAVLADVDVLAMPTNRRTTFSIEAANKKYASGDWAAMASEARFENTIIFDATGQPAITVPCGLTSGGLPVGLMFVARQWDEPTLLRAARAYELVRGPFPAPTI
jgi:Asp-tRNA(Asn)/Glu-tRNA(Gln) amidotransferase A subunit family amidase